LSAVSRGLRAFVMDARGTRIHKPGLAAWLRRVAPAKARGAVNIALVPDARMRALNRQFRGVDRATDVLSFPHQPPGAGRQRSGAASRQKARARGTGLDKSLGDIVIARGVARRQAQRAGHSEMDELRVLALHGLLHLMGYDHHGDNGAMERMERRLRRKGGLREGLIERAHKQ
jgi:probable rRNA maturation factor